MPKASAGPRSEHPPLTMRYKPAQKKFEPQTVAMSDSPAAISLDLEASKFDLSSYGVPDTENAIASDNSSPDSSDSSSEDGSDTSYTNGSSSFLPDSSSPDNLHTSFPESNMSDSDTETVILWDPAAKHDLGTVPADNCSSEEPNGTPGDFYVEDLSYQPNAVWDKSSQSSSDAETVILWDPAAKNGSDMVSADNTGSDNPSVISGDFTQENPDMESKDTSDSASDDGSDSSSQEGSDTFSPVGPRSLSPVSSTTSSQDPVDNDELAPRISRGSQNICAYASPAQGGRRIRTSCDSNDDIGRWHVDRDGFINEARRAGGPYLFPLPVIKLELKANDPLNMILEDLAFLQSMISIFAEHKINAISMKLRKCEYEFMNELDYLPTLIFSATRDTFDDSWVQACRKIWRLLSDRGFGQVNVEISDYEATPWSVWPIRKTDPIWPVYMDILQRIQAEVDVTYMIGLRINRMGKADSRERSPLTVSMDVRYDTHRDWRATRDHIVKLLDDMDLPMVGVIITKGKNWRGLFYPEERKT
ncbi:hypothetical protein N7491_008083 [Penicillium cf. griseofulvum]|nr:hypothetical protein N7491_008083 [Penicillium cf. griseofulvum]